MAAWSDIRPTVDRGVVALLHRVRAVAAVAPVSTATTRLEWDLARQGPADLADSIVNTARIGVAEPDARVYRIAAASVGAAPHRCRSWTTRRPTSRQLARSGWPPCTTDASKTSVGHSPRSCGRRKTNAPPRPAAHSDRTPSNRPDPGVTPTRRSRRDIRAHHDESPPVGPRRPRTHPSSTGSSRAAATKPLGPEPRGRPDPRIHSGSSTPSADPGLCAKKTALRRFTPSPGSHSNRAVTTSPACPSRSTIRSAGGK